jgi:hypothetical protein
MPDLSHIVVANVNVRRLPEDFDGSQAMGLVYIDTCSRKTWIGIESNFAELPSFEPYGLTTEMLKGGDAYEFLLRVKAGLDSPKLGETNIDGQLTRCFNAFAYSNPSKYSELSDLFEFLARDTRYIRANYVSQLQKSTFENAARMLANSKAGQEILVVGKTGKTGAVSQVTIDIAVAHSDARTIYVTGPNAEDGQAIFAKLNTADIRKKIPIKTKIVVAPFSDVAQYISQGCHVFIDQPMADNPWNDSYLIQSWRANKCLNRAMVHLRGCPSLMGLSTKVWKNSDLESYFSPEEVREAKVAIDRRNEILISNAHRSTSEIAEARLSGSTQDAYRLLQARGFVETQYIDHRVA